MRGPRTHSRRRYNAMLPQSAPVYLTARRDKPQPVSNTVSADRVNTLTAHERWFGSADDLNAPGDYNISVESPRADG